MRSLSTTMIFVPSGDQNGRLTCGPDPTFSTSDVRALVARSMTSVRPVPVL